MEQKVWIKTSKPVYPNQYIFIVGAPGVGKIRIIREGQDYVRDIDNFYMAPSSMTFAALVDRLEKSKREITKIEDGLTLQHKYNTMFICVDEIGAFISKYDNEMIDGLSAFYDNIPWGQERRTNELKLKDRPQPPIQTSSSAPPHKT